MDTSVESPLPPNTAEATLARVFLAERSGTENVAFYEQEGSRMWAESVAAARRGLAALAAARAGEAVDWGALAWAAAVSEYPTGHVGYDQPVLSTHRCDECYRHEDQRNAYVSGFLAAQPAVLAHLAAQPATPAPMRPGESVADVLNRWSTGPAIAQMVVAEVRAAAFAYRPDAPPAAPTAPSPAREALAETIRGVIGRCQIDGVDPAPEIADVLAFLAAQPAPAPVGDGKVGATHPAHWDRHGHPGDPCPPSGCYGGAQYGAGCEAL